MRFSKLDAKEFMKVAKLILKGDPQGEKFIKRLVDEIVSDLKKQEYEDEAAKWDEDDLDDIDLADLGL
jgi:hypothetical protein